MSLGDMFKKLMGGSAAPAPQSEAPRTAAAALYDPLFCDRPDDFAPKGPEATDWQRILYAPAPDPAAVRALADDVAVESRVRLVAFNWLRTHGHEVPKGQVLGIVLEVPVEAGLDVLAAYADGRVRYLNHRGGAEIIEPESLEAANRLAVALVQAGQSIIARIGPWDKDRLLPPRPPHMRVSFLVSDGLYFGEGPFDGMSRDDMAGPLIQQGGELLQVVVNAATARR